MATFYPTAKYPDLHNQQTVTDAGKVVLDELTQIFGPPQGDFQHSFAADAFQRYDNQTLRKAYEGVNVTMTNLLMFHLEELNKGWWTELARPERTEGLEREFQTTMGSSVVLDRAPEGVAPRFVTLSKETRTERMVRFNMGAKENNDFYKTKMGRDSMAQKQFIIITAAVIACKLIVEQTVIYEKQWYREWEKKNGAIYVNVRESLLAEIENFGAFNKDKQALYKLNAYIEQIVRESGTGVNLDRMVVCAGALQHISIGNSFETMPNIRGVEQANRTLIGNSVVMQSMIPGKFIYENPSWTLENVGPDEIQSFRRLAVIGQYIMIDGSDHGIGREKYNAAQELSVKHRDLKIDSYSLWDVKTAIDQCMRWDANGNLSKAHDFLIKDLQSNIQRSGIKIVAGLVDPYIWQSSAQIGADSRDSRLFNTDNLHKIQHWGDMNTHYWSVDQNLLHGEHAAAQIRRSNEMDADDFTNLKDYKELSKELYAVSTLLSDKVSTDLFLSYVAATLLTTDVKTKKPGLLIIAGNRFGSLQLPSIESIPVDNTKTPVVFIKVFVVDNGTKRVSPKFSDGALSWSEVAADKNTPTNFNQIPATAPDFKPYGFAGINHFRYLAEQGSMFGYDPTIFTRARSIVRSVDRYASVLKKFYPDCEFWSPNWTPGFAKSGNDNYDSISSFVFNIFDQVRYPTWFNYGGKATAGIDITKPTSTSDILVALKTIFSLAADFNPDVGKLIATGLRDVVVDFVQKDPASVSKTFKEDNSLGPALGVVIGSKQAVTLKEFYELYIAKDLLTNPKGVANLIVSILSLIYSASQGQVTVPLSLLLINQMKATGTDSSSKLQAFPSSKSKKREHDQEKSALDLLDSNNPWFNSRLLFEPDLFRVIAENGNTGALKDHIRPENPFMGREVNLDNRQKSSKGDPIDVNSLFEFARARDQRVTDKSSAFFHSDLFAQSTDKFSDSNKRSRLDDSAETHMEDQERASQSFPGSFEQSDKRRVTYGVVKDKTGPFWTAGEGGVPIARKHNLTHRLREIIERASDEVRIPALLLIFTRVVKRSLLNWVSKNLPIPDSVYVLAQPWVRLYTEGMVAYSSDGSVATLMYGHEDVSNQYDNTGKTWQIHYTIWLGCGIKDPRKIMFIPDVRICGYEGGMDANVYTRMDEFDPKNFDLKTAKAGFCFSMGSRWSREVALREANPMSLYGKYQAASLPHHYQEESAFYNEGPQWPSFPFYDSIWQLSRINDVHAPPVLDSFDALRRSQFINGLMFMTHHVAWSHTGGDWTRTITATGHLPDGPPPMLQMLTGKVPILNNLNKD